MGFGSGEQRVNAPAERAFACISRSFLDVQKNAEIDIQLMTKRAQHIKKIATSYDDWESIRLPLGNGKDVSAGQLIQHLKESSRSLSVSPRKVDLLGKSYIRFDESDGPKFLQKIRDSSKALTTGASLEDIEILKNFRQHMDQPFRRVKSDPDLTRPEMEGKQSHRKTSGSLKSRSRTFMPDEWDMGPAARNWQLTSEKWEPLKKVKESLKDLEMTAAQSKNPSEFFNNMKKNLNVVTPLADISTPQEVVAPLDVPELLEDLVRRSEPLLGQLGINKDVSSKVRKLIRSCKTKRASTTAVASASLATVPATPEASNEGDLDHRLASVFQSTGYRHPSGNLGEQENAPSSSRRRNVAIVTTASLPWMTGTAVNPLLRAAYLAKHGDQDVTLLVPWLSEKDQEMVYPNKITFKTPAEQEQYVRDWLHARVGFCSDFKITFYPGQFSLEKRSILAVGDISSYVSDRDADIAVLEEPEHLTWYYHGRRWTDKFKHVVGVVHTNYLEYVKREKNGPIQAYFLEHVNNWMVRAYCSKVIRLSAATQEMPRSVVCNVHGVGSKFLAIGDQMAEDLQRGKQPFSKGVYYLGKMVWSKGYRELVDLMASNAEALGGLKVDVFGSGEDSGAVQTFAQQHHLRIKFHKGRDHADTSLQLYKVFVNPSLSDVVCTTTAEALAMGKIVICADHPSNEFFRSFPNCLTYRTADEFVKMVRLASEMKPVPLTPEQRHLLTWEAATDRFIDISGMNAVLPKPADNSKNNVPLVSDSPAQTSGRGSTGSTLLASHSSNSLATLNTSSLSMTPMPAFDEKVDNGLALAHFVASGFEPARMVAGALPNTMHCGPKHSEELGLPHPWVQRPVYGW